MHRTHTLSRLKRELLNRMRCTISTSGRLHMSSFFSACQRTESSKEITQFLPLLVCRATELPRSVPSKHSYARKRALFLAHPKSTPARGPCIVSSTSCCLRPGALAPGTPA